MVVCVEQSGLFYEFLIHMTQNVTGSLFMTLLLIMIMMFGVLIALRMPLEFSAIVMLPMLLALMACEAGWMTITGLALIYLGILLGKNFFFR